MEEKINEFAQNPKFIMLDEPDSGVDLVSINLVVCEEEPQSQNIKNVLQYLE